MIIFVKVYKYNLCLKYTIKCNFRKSMLLFLVYKINKKIYKLKYS